MSRSPEGYGSGASGLIHLTAKGVEKITNDLSLCTYGNQENNAGFPQWSFPPLRFHP